jgi:hypothetical protein
MLANRLAPKLGRLISYNQNAFIKKICIHDNFVFIQQVIQDLHRKKVPALFIKLDIFKAFDMVNWSYVISVLWGTSSSSFLINGEPGRKIHHRRGVR